MVCGPSSLRSRSSWKYLRLNLQPPPTTFDSSRPFVLSTIPRFYALRALAALSLSQPPLVLQRPIPRRSHFFFFLVFFLALSLSSLPGFFSSAHSPSSPPPPPLVRKIVIGPSATSDHSGKQPRERTPDSGKGLRVVRGQGNSGSGGGGGDGGGERSSGVSTLYHGGCWEVQGTQGASFHPHGSEPAIPSL